MCSNIEDIPPFNVLPDDFFQEEKPPSKVICRSCKGHGRAVKRRTANDAIVVICKACGGTGYVDEE